MGKYVIKTGDGKKHRTKIFDALADKGMSQSDLVRETKMMHGQVSLIVQGVQTDMLLSTAKRICNSLNMSLDELWGEGALDYKTQSLKFIEIELAKLDDKDIYGKLWLEKFRDFVIKMQP